MPSRLEFSTQLTAGGTFIQQQPHAAAPALLARPQRLQPL
jgi:hypothetical protein